MTPPTKYTPKRVRVVEDQITHELTRTILDDVQLAFERVAANLEAQSMPFSRGDRMRYLDKLAGFLARMYEHTDADQEPADVKDRLILVLSRRLAICSALLTKCAERKGA